MRLDVWLWTTRAFRSRSLATAAVRAGHVRVNGSPAKPSYKLAAGDTVRIRDRGHERVWEVVSLPPKRLGAPLARKCYVDHSLPKPNIYGSLPVREPGTGRPTKKERRQLEKLRGEEWARHSRR